MTSLSRRPYLAKVLQKHTAGRWCYRTFNWPKLIARVCAKRNFALIFVVGFAAAAAAAVLASRERSSKSRPTKLQTVRMLRG
jgi:hypothetical protein